MQKKHWLTVSFLFVFPVVIISLPGVPLWLGRAAATSIFFFSTTFFIFWFGLSPKSKMIRGGTLAEPRFDKVRSKIELTMRITVVAFGLIFLGYDTLPLASDLLHLVIGEMRTTLSAKVAYRTTALGGVLLGENSVRLVPSGESYYIFYNWTKPLRVGDSYEFVVLPRSRMILDFRDAKNSVN